MTYSEKLQNPLWQKKRLEILNRDQFTCKLCLDNATTLHVHHKKYIKGHEPWQYDDDNFMTLCKHCHFIVESVSLTEGFEFMSVEKVVVNDSLTDIWLFVMRERDGVTGVVLGEIYNGKYTTKTSLQGKQVAYLHSVLELLKAKTNA